MEQGPMKQGSQSGTQMGGFPPLSVPVGTCRSQKLQLFCVCGFWCGVFPFVYKEVNEETSLLFRSTVDTKIPA